MTRPGSGDADSYYGSEADEGAETAVQSVCEAQARKAVEPEAQGELSDEDWVAWFFPVDGPRLTSAAAVVIEDLGEFEIQGRPSTWRNPRTTEDHLVQVNLTRTAGPEDEAS